MESQGWAVYGDFTWAINDRARADRRRALHLRQEGNDERRARQRRGARQQLQLRVLHERPRSATRRTGTTSRRASHSPSTSATTSRCTRRHREATSPAASRPSAYDLHGQDINDDGSAPAGTTPLEFDPEQVDSYEIGAKTRLLDNTTAAQRLAVPLRLHGPSARLFRPGLLAGRERRRGERPGARAGPALGAERALGCHGRPFAARHRDHGRDGYHRGRGLRRLRRQQPAVRAGGQRLDDPHLPHADRLGREASSRRSTSTARRCSAGRTISPDATVESWDESNFRLGYRSASTWYVNLWVENAFDEVYFERGWENADADNQFGYGLFNELVWPSRPRTVGITFGMEWE